MLLLHQSPSKANLSTRRQHSHPPTPKTGAKENKQTVRAHKQPTSSTKYISQPIKEMNIPMEGHRSQGKCSPVSQALYVEANIECNNHSN